jgi:hypothetical protein
MLPANREHDMHKVYTHENLAIVSSAKNLLALNGIESSIKNEYYASGGHVGIESVPLELWVSDAAEAERAIAILEKELDPNSKRPQWQCPNCGEINEGSFDCCWQCQSLPEQADQTN